MLQINPELYTTYALPPIDQGATWSVDVQWLVGNSTINVAPLDLTDYSLSLVARERFGAPVVITLATANGITTTDAANGQFTITLTSNATSVITAPHLLYDILYQRPDNTVGTFVRGRIDVNRGVAESFTISP